MGGGDLNLKKSWHPSKYVNLKRLWEVEQKHISEMQKLEELRKEKEHERELSELRQLQEKAGLRRTQSEKLDWMYSHSVVDKKEVENEAIITGKRAAAQRIEETFPKQTKTSDKIITSRLSEDPLFDMKSTELKKGGPRKNPRIGKVSK